MGPVTHSMPARPGTARGTVPTLALAALAGLAVGAATQVLQGILPGAWNWLANSMSAWLIVGFLFGATTARPRVAAAAGVVLLLAALLGYEVTVEARFGTGFGPLVAFWALGAVAGGVVFGAAGWGWRRGGPRVRAISTGLPAALLIGEGLYFLAILPGPETGIGAIVIGLALPALLGRTNGDRARAYVALVPCLALAAAGFAATLALYGVVTG